MAERDVFANGVDTELPSNASSSSLNELEKRKSGNEAGERRVKRSQSEEPVPLKDRVYTTLCRFRYGWSFRSSVEIIGEVPIWLLGHCYHADERDRGRYSSDTEGAPPHIMSFMEHFNTLAWMTYRTNFPAIAGTNITTDCGWGCMVRSGQMILATALTHYLLGPDWRLGRSSSKDRLLHKQILSWFADAPDPKCPFSLHSLMDVAVKLGHQPGDWFGPSQLAVLIRECVGEARKREEKLTNLFVYMAHDCTVYMGDVEEMYESDPDSSLLLLVPVRLGSESLNPIYIPCVKSLLALDHCVGIIGGKPKHSVYFVGFQNDKLVHLDPHYCQAATHASEDPWYRDFESKSYHCNTPRKLPARRMDPSCTIGFLCRTSKDLHNLRAKAEKVLAPPLQRGVYPFFSFSDDKLTSVLDVSVATRMMSNEDITCDGFVLEDDFRVSPGRDGRHKKKGKDGFEDLTFNEDEDFVVVECRRVSQTPESSPKSETNRTLPETEFPKRNSPSALEATDF